MACQHTADNPNVSVLKDGSPFVDCTNIPTLDSRLRCKKEGFHLTNIIVSDLRLDDSGLLQCKANDDVSLGKNFTVVPNSDTTGEGN